jgi:hypothetical protein
MQPRRCLALGGIAAALMLAGSGCGSGAAKLYKVSGKVTLDGKPVSHATVEFEPVDPAGGQKPASGQTGEDGTFTLTTNTSGDGAAAGKYKVAIKKLKVSSEGSFAQRPDGDTTNPKTMMELQAKAMANQRKQTSAPKAPDNELPAEYGSLDRTPLTAEVPSPAYEFAMKKGGGT